VIEGRGWSWGRLVREALAQRDYAWLCLLAIGIGLALLDGPHEPFVLVAIGVGVLLWLPEEYVFHRFVLHLPRLPWRLAWQIQKRAHYKHHRVPDDARYLFIPMWTSPGLIALGGALGAGLLGGRGWLACAFGQAVMLCLYELTHFAAHMPYRPRTRWGRTMKRHHLLHHYKHERYWFGVTTPLGDWIARTWPDPERVPRSRTARSLAREP
jgi:fatty acid hydroxylase family protein